MTTVDFIREHHACRAGARWAMSISDNMAEVWDALVNQGNHAWLLWVVTRPGVFQDSTLRRLACRFIRETPVGGGKTVWDLLYDVRSRKAVEVSEAYADGNATEAELDAAYAAAYAVARASADAAARSAARAAERAAYFAASSYTAAKSTQVKMIAELGNPFKKGIIKMSTNKHTPGPWAATRILGDWWIEEDDPTAFCRRRIAVVDNGAGIDSLAAYARLIAAAPELLAALEEAKQFIQNGIEYGYINMPEKRDHDSATETPGKIEAAIRKAKMIDEEKEKGK